MKKLAILLLVTGCAYGQAIYPQAKPRTSRPRPAQTSPSYAPKGTLYEDKNGQIQRSEGNGQSTNVTGKYRPETFQPVSNPGTHPASGSKLKVTPIKSSTLDVSPL